MTSAQVVETSVTNNSSFQNYTHPDDHTTRTMELINKQKFLHSLKKEPKPTYLCMLVWFYVLFTIAVFTLKPKHN